MANIVHPLALKETSVLLVTIDGKTEEHPTVTCKHCGRVYTLRASKQMPLADLLATLKRCTSCDGYVCPSPACRVGCNPFKADVERAYREDHKQPWMLREGKLNEPVLRVNGVLIPRAQSGYTERELARMSRPGSDFVEGDHHVDQEGR